MNDFTSPDKIIDLLGAASEPAVQCVEVWFKGTRHMSEEIVRFTGDRLRRDADAWTAITQSGNVGTALEAQQRWVSTAIREYTTESQRLFSIGGEIMQGFLSKMGQQSTALTKK